MQLEKVCMAWFTASNLSVIKQWWNSFNKPGPPCLICPSHWTYLDLNRFRLARMIASLSVTQHIEIWGRCDCYQCRWLPVVFETLRFRLLTLFCIKTPFPIGECSLRLCQLNSYWEYQNGTFWILRILWGWIVLSLGILGILCFSTISKLNINLKHTFNDNVCLKTILNDYIKNWKLSNQSQKIEIEKLRL